MAKKFSSEPENVMKDMAIDVKKRLIQIEKIMERQFDFRLPACQDIDKKLAEIGEVVDTMVALYNQNRKDQ